MHKQFGNRFLFDAEGDGQGGAGTGDATGKTYTQAELDRMFGDRATRAGEAATKKLLEDLGLKDPAELKARLQAAKEAEDAQGTALDKATKAEAREKARADQAETDRKTALARADEKLLRAAVVTEATAQGVDDAELKTLWLLLKDDTVLRAKITPKPGDDDEFEGVKDVIGELVKAHPRWLKADQAAIETNATRRNAAEGSMTSEEAQRRKRAGGGYSSL